MTVVPDFLPSRSCLDPAFRIQLSIIVGGGDDVILRGLRFEFVDHVGVRVLPSVLPVHASSGITSLSSPAPGTSILPGAAPIPIPGFEPVTGLLVTSGSARRLPFILEFGCGVPGSGIIIVTGDLTDRRGKEDTTTTRILVKKP